MTGRGLWIWTSPPRSRGFAAAAASFFFLPAYSETGAINAKASKIANATTALRLRIECWRTLNIALLSFANI